MVSSIKWVFVFITFLLQACTIATYQVINKISYVSPQKVSEPCDIKYSLSFTFRHKWSDDNVDQDIKNKYIESTNESFGKKGCTATYVESEKDADIRVQVERGVDLGGRGDSLIVGLTLGLLPMWGTREGVFAFTFSNTKAKTAHSYIVDEKYYIHLFLLPVLWLNYFTENQFKSYKESLINFIENCNAGCDVPPPP